MIKYLASIPIPLFIILIAVLAVWDVRTVYEPPLLLPILNTIFLAVFPFIASLVAIKVYFISGFLNVFLLGCGMLALGSGSLIGGWMLGICGVNCVVTLHNTGALLGSLFHAAGAVLTLTVPIPQKRIKRYKIKGIIAYSAVLVFMIFLSVMSYYGITPAFFIQGSGPTLLRQGILELASVMFIFSSLILMSLQRLHKSEFLYWYSMALILIAIGLSAIFMQKSFGSLIGWTGRTAQYLAGVYILIAVSKNLISLQNREMSADRAVAFFFRDMPGNYRLLTESSDDAILSFDEQGRILMSNSAFETMFGRSKDELSGAAVNPHILSDEFIRIITDEINKLSPSELRYTVGKPLQAEMKTKDNKIFSAEISLSGRYTALGWMNLAIVRDVTEKRKMEEELSRRREYLEELIQARTAELQTAYECLKSEVAERRQAEDALRESEERFRTLVQLLPVGVYLTDDRGNSRFVNQRWCEFSGLAPDEAVGDGWVKGIFTDDREKIFSAWNTMTASCGKRGLEYRFQNREGKITWVYGLATPRYDRFGKISGYIGINLDITDRKRAEELLQESEEKYRRIVETALEGIWLIDLTGKTLYINKRTAEILGYTVEEMQDVSAFQFLVPDQHHEVKDSLQRRQKGMPDIAERCFIRKDGTKLWTIISASPIRDKQGQVIGSMGMLSDITDRRKAENLLNARMRLLELDASHSSEELLRATLDEIEAQTGSVIGFFHFLEPDQQTISLQTWSTNTINLWQTEGRRQHYDISEAGVWIDCIHARQTIIHNDYSVLPHRKGLPAGHVPIVRELIAPIIRNGLIVAVLGVGNKPSDYTEQDSETVMLLADLAWDQIGRRRSDEERRKSEKNYRKLFENANIGIFQSTPDGRFLNANPALVSMLGYDSRDELIRLINNIGEQLYADSEKRNKIISSVLQSDDWIFAENQYRRKDGSIITGKLSVRKELNPDGSVEYLEGFVEDITARKQAEDALKYERERFFSILEQLPAFVYLVSQDRSIVYTNRRFCINFGAPGDEIMQGYKSPCESCLRFNRLDPGKHDERECFCRYTGVVFQIYEYPFTDIDGSPLILKLGVDITERKRAEEALKSSEEKFSKVFHHAPLMMAISDLSTGTFIDVNQKFLDISGCTRQEVIGKTSSELQWVSPDERARRIKMIQAVGYIQDQDTVVWTKDRKPVHCLYSCVIITINGEQRLLSISHDITDRKQAEERLNFQADLLNNVQQAVIATDPAGVVIYMNAFAESLYKWSAKDAVGRHITDVTVPEITKVQAHEIMAALANGEIWQGDFLVQRKDGSTFLSYVTDSPVYNASGELTAIIGISSDVTERRQMEESLADEKNRLLAVMEILPVGVVVLNAQSGIIHSNKAYKDIWGKTDSADDYAPYKAWRTDTGKRVQPDEWASARAVQKGETVIGQLMKIERFDGSYAFVMNSAVPIYDKTGKIAGSAAAVMDITELRHAEEELRKATQAAESANKAKSEFLANMSHEIRTPISGIIGTIKMMLTYDLESDAKQHLEMMKYSAESLLSIINDILDFSRIDAGKMELCPADFDFYYMTECVRSTLSVEAENKKLLLQIRISPDVPRYLHGDEIRLKQVLVNLVGNAVKFTEQGMITLNVEKTDEPCKLLFSVTDTGIGIPENRFSDLFESFVQLDASYSKKYQGTGLGLAISKRLAEMMGGTIRLESKEGKGSTFYFTAEFEKALSEEIPLCPPFKKGDFINREPAKHTAEPVILPCLKILVAEDDELNRMSLVHILETAGHRVISVSDGRQAIEAFKKEPFDVILMDIQMPETDGIEAARAIKNYESEILNSQFSIPIIAMTAYTLKGNREQFINAGMDEYLPKPVDKEKLFYAIRKLLENTAVPELGSDDSAPAPVTKPRPGSEKAEHCIADIVRYIEQYKNDKEFLNNILESFIRETPVRMETLAQAIFEKDFEQIAKAAHSITNLVSAVRIYSAANYAKELEKAARNQYLKEVLPLYGLLKQEMEKIIEYLN